MTFPLTARFKLLAIAQQVSVTDSTGALIYYARQKAFKLREAVTVFADQEQTRPVFSLSADRVLDVSARYTITGQGGAKAGVVQREGMKSIWRTSYTIETAADGTFTLRELNPLAKLADGLFGAIPIVGALSGYLFHPKYEIARASGEAVLRIEKKPALFEGRFEIDRAAGGSSPAFDVLLVASVMMLLLERQRG